MILNTNYRKFLLAGGSLLVLLVLGVVLGLTVMRIQNQQTTITLPKATGGLGPAVTWPSCVNAQGVPASCRPYDLIDNEGKPVNPPGGYYWCTNDDCFNSSNDKRNINKCCSKVKDDPWACEWPARGWCTPAQCPSSGGKMCGLYIYNTCSNCYGLGNYNGSCSWQYDCVTGQNCVNGTCVTTNNSCWVNVPIPKNGVPQGNSESTMPTFSWDYDTTYSSDVKNVGVYLFSCPARNDSCLVGVAYGNGSGFKSANLSSFGKSSLSPNTTYYWGVTVNSYSPPSTQYDCMPKWQFTTGAGTPANTVPNCTNLTGPTTLTVGQKGTYSADFSSPQGNLGGEIFAGQNGQGVWFPGNRGISGNSGTLSFDWTPTTAGTYDVLCRAWNDAVAECQGKSNYIDGPPRYACAGPNSSMTVTVAAAGCPSGQTLCSGVCKNLQTDLANCGTCGNACTTGQTCVNGTCTGANTCTSDPDCSGGNVCAFP